MIKCEVIKEFTYSKFDELKNIVRNSKELHGKLYVYDTFECDIDTARYLLGNNPRNKIVVRVIEIKK